MLPYWDKMRCKGIKYFDCSKFFIKKKSAGLFVPEHKIRPERIYVPFYPFIIDSAELRPGSQ